MSSRTCTPGFGSWCEWALRSISGCKASPSTTSCLTRLLIECLPIQKEITKNKKIQDGQEPLTSGFPRESKQDPKRAKKGTTQMPLINPARRGGGPGGMLAGFCCLLASALPCGAHAQSLFVITVDQHLSLPGSQFMHDTPETLSLPWADASALPRLGGISTFPGAFNVTNESVGSWHSAVEWADSFQEMVLQHPIFCFGIWGCCVLVCGFLACWVGGVFRAKRKRRSKIKLRPPKNKPRNHLLSSQACRVGGCRFVGASRVKKARIRCRWKANKRYSRRISYKRFPSQTAPKSNINIQTPSPHPEPGEWFSISYVNLLRSRWFDGGVVSHPYKPPKKKKRYQGSSGNSVDNVTRGLIHLLKTCLNGGTKLPDVIQLVEGHLAKNASQETYKAQKKKQRPKTKNRPGPGSPNKESPKETPIMWWYDKQGTAKPYTIDAKGWWTWVNPSNPPITSGNPMNRPKAENTRAITQAPAKFLASVFWIGLRMSLPN